VEYVFFAGAGVMALAVAALRFGAASRRRARLLGFATSFGLDYSPVDPFGLIDHRFDLFDRADAARCENVVWGNWHGVQVKVGELRFEPDGKRRRDIRRTAKRFSFAIVEIDAWLPHLVIRRDFLAGVSENLLLPRLRFESDAFNRTYRVECDEERFAYKFVDPRMMLWLQEIGESFRFEFEVRGDRALVWCGRLKPFALIPLLGVAKGFADHVPRVVLRDEALIRPNPGQP
jgi:hypothetical protein